MRISDWSSDVCSSDLCWLPSPFPLAHVRPARKTAAWTLSISRSSAAPTMCLTSGPTPAANCPLARWNGWMAGSPPSDLRSEEHTSELQSLMRISYAVFGLKKKINKKQYGQNSHTSEL